MEIAILADTHLPRGTRRLPESCVELLERSELIIHAGDFMRLAVLRELERYGEVVAVHGNVDDAELRALLPARRTLQIHDMRIGLVHDAGPARRRIARLRGWFPDSHAAVFGHSHIPLHECAPDGFQIFNPGSPTERRRSPRHTMGLAHVTGAAITFELIALG